MRTIGLCVLVAACGSLPTPPAEFADAGRALGCNVGFELQTNHAAPPDCWHANGSPVDFFWGSEVTAQSDGGNRFVRLEALTATSWPAIYSDSFAVSPGGYSVHAVRRANSGPGKMVISVGWFNAAREPITESNPPNMPAFELDHFGSWVDYAGPAQVAPAGAVFAQLYAELSGEGGQVDVDMLELSPL